MKMKIEKTLELTDEEIEVLINATELVVEIGNKLWDNDEKSLKDFTDYPLELTELYAELREFMED